MSPLHIMHGITGCCRFMSGSDTAACFVNRRSVEIDNEAYDSASADLCFQLESAQSHSESLRATADQAESLSTMAANCNHVAIGRRLLPRTPAVRPQV